MKGHPSVSAARWLVGVMVSVVVAFLLATLAAQHLDGAVATRANDIIANAMPSVQLLSSARGNLRRLEHAFEAAASTDASAKLQSEVESLRRDLDEALASYAALPFFSDEPAQYAQVLQVLATLDRDRASWSLAPGLTADALGKLREDFSRVDEALERMVRFDAEQGQRLGLEIEHIRAQSAGLVALLHGLSVALALVGVALALRQLRRAALARRAERAEREHREAALAAQNEALGEFAGRVAHDILSPLTTAMLSLDIVRQSCPRDPVTTRATERGVAAVHRVHALVEDLLSFARAGGQAEPGVAAEIAPVLTDLLDGLAMQAQEQRISLTLAPVPPGAVACSTGVLTSVVLNLVRNAMKYMGDASDRRIEVRVLDAATRWRIEVSDTGPGIPEDQQQRIFEPYVQLGRRREGIGLGLAIVDRLVRSHGGAVGVRSNPGAGALFWFELPKVHAPDPVRSDSAELAAGVA